MNHFERSSVINSTNDGNHINRPPDEGLCEEEQLVKCDECQRMIDQHQHYVNGGICWFCISRIGG